MELFRTAKAVTLRGHLDKYLVADDDKVTVRQSRNGLSRRARWIVEGIGHVIRLKSCHGRYLTASDTAFLFGMTGKKVIQTVPGNSSDSLIEWEPIRDGFQVKFRTRSGKFLRANGGTPPWRNSVTHDHPHSGATKNWILWDVESVEAPEPDPLADYLSSLSSFSSISDDLYGSAPESPMSITATDSFGMSSKRVCFLTCSGTGNMVDSTVLAVSSNSLFQLRIIVDLAMIKEDMVTNLMTSYWIARLSPGWGGLL